jgi:hypothetical protein
MLHITDAPIIPVQPRNPKKVIHVIALPYLVTRSTQRPAGVNPRLSDPKTPKGP